MTIPPEKDIQGWSALWRWRGSVWKAVWRYYIIYVAIHISLNLLYRHFFTPPMQDFFESMVLQLQQWNVIIPIQFLLGFYVNTVFSRWWTSLSYVSFPDRFLAFVNVNLPGIDNLLVRRTFFRLSNLQCVMVWKEISAKVKRRFPTTGHVVDCGLMTTDEMQLYDDTPGLHGKWFLPTFWMTNLIAKCYDEKRITDYARQRLTSELMDLRGQCGMLTIYDWINIPLVYIQATRFATLGYFIFALIARQELIVREESMYKETIEKIAYLSTYIPILTTLEFVFYVGWLRVGDKLLVPFGEDDEDFDMNYITDRNLFVNNLQVDESTHHQPSISMDKFIYAREAYLPYTIASLKMPYRDSIPPWRFSNIQVKEADQQFFHDNKQLTKRELSLIANQAKHGGELIPEIAAEVDNKETLDAEHLSCRSVSSPARQRSSKKETSETKNDVQENEKINLPFVDEKP